MMLSSQEHKENLAQADRHLERILEHSTRQYEEMLKLKCDMLKP